MVKGGESREIFSEHEQARLSVRGWKTVTREEDAEIERPVEGAEIWETSRSGEEYRGIEQASKTQETVMSQWEVKPKRKRGPNKKK